MGWCVRGFPLLIAFLYAHRSAAPSLSAPNSHEPCQPGCADGGRSRFGKCFALKVYSRGDEVGDF